MSEKMNRKDKDSCYHAINNEIAGVFPQIKSVLVFAILNVNFNRGA